MAETTVIKDADWVIAWDDELNSHTYLRNADVAFMGNEITFVGRDFPGKADKRIDGNRLMVMPGLVNIHSHPCEDTFMKGINEGGASANQGKEGEITYIENIIAQTEFMRGANDEDLRPYGAEMGYSELLLSGVTTLLDICESMSYPGWVELLEKSGLRAYLGPMVPSLHPYDFTMEEQLEAGLKIIDRAMASDTGRLSGAVVILPSDDVELLPPDLVRRSLDEARKRRIPWKVHGGQMFIEVDFVRDHHKMSPIEVLDKMGVLGPETILVHAHLFDHHPALKNKGPFKDLDIAALSGASVSHCPFAFALSCLAMHDFARYRKAGINIGIGTDIFAHNMLEEMRYVLLFSRIISGEVDGSTTTDVFNAATIGGAKALNRDDIGYIGKGAKADLVLVDLDHPAMKPVNDPLRSLILQAAERAVRDVYVDGKLVVQDRKVLTLDYEGASAKLDEKMRRMISENVLDNVERKPTVGDAGLSMFALPVREV